jgi:gliding motility-associated-like protein
MGIYICITRENQNFLGVIDNPDVLGVGCDYNQNGATLNGKISKAGLPNFHSSIFSSPVNINNFCFGDTTSFMFTGSVDSVLWNLGDSTLSTLFSPTHVFQDTGTYTITLLSYLGAATDTLLDTIKIINPIANFALIPAVTFIDNTDITFTNLSSGHSSSVWDFDDGSSLLNDNSLSIVHHYDNPGDYIIKLEVTSNFGCVASAINSLEIIPFEYFFPDAFTPNSDALNDVFNINTTKVKSFEMEIFDRWGESVYITKNVWKPWDGTFNGTALEQGVYAYKIWVKDPQDILHKMVGNVLLVR